MNHDIMNGLFERLWAKKVSFLAVFFFVFTISYTVLVIVDFLPEPPAEEAEQVEPAEEAEAATATTPAQQAESEARIGSVAATESEEPRAVPVAPVLPTSITIERLDKTIPVLNPTSRVVADLDAALLDGVVRHPDSATLSQEGNVFILGHSSYLPNVINPNFQAFNGIEDLEWGDTITLDTADEVYTYRVEKVYQARAQDVTVPIAGTGNKLTLATCDSFGSIDDRFIVEAKRISVAPK